MTVPSLLRLHVLVAEDVHLHLQLSPVLHVLAELQEALLEVRGAVPRVVVVEVPRVQARAFPRIRHFIHSRGAH